MKNKRQLKILELIDRYSVETQEELAERLKNEGFDVTQATISRDIKELRIFKVPTPRAAINTRQRPWRRRTRYRRSWTPYSANAS